MNKLQPIIPRIFGRKTGAAGLLAAGFLLLLTAFSAQAQVDGKQVFQDNCAVCHKMGEKVIGPDLTGVHDRRSADWIVSFIKNSPKMIADGDEQAVKVFAENNNMPMTPFEGSLSDEDIAAVSAWLKDYKPEEKPAEVVSVPDPVPAETPVVPEKSWLDTTPLPYLLAGSLFLTVLMLLIIVMISLAFKTASLLSENEPEVAKKSGVVRLLNALSGDNPEFFTGKISDTDFAGDAHDGIHELDNSMPPWLAWFFYGTIAFAIIYFLNYQVFKWSDLQIDEYKTELADAEKKYGSADKLNVTVVQLNDAAALASGKEIYTKNCAVCHRADGGGTVGPNLTDDSWLHGGTVQDIFKTVRLGVPAKGMIAWKGQLKDKEILEVSSYIMSLAGTNPAGAKAAEGEKMK